MIPFNIQTSLPESMYMPVIFLMIRIYHYDFCHWSLTVLEGCVWKLTQIVRFSEKSLLCNVSMKYVSGRLSLSGGLSYFSGHAPATLRYAALHSILQNRMQVVASASALRNIRIPPGGEYGKTRSTNIETAKQLDFSKSVSDKTILVSLACGYSKTTAKIIFTLRT